MNWVQMPNMPNVPGDKKNKRKRLPATSDSINADRALACLFALIFVVLLLLL